MKKITINGHTAEVSEDVYFFYQMLKAMDREPNDFNEFVSDLQNFTRLWDQFKAMKESDEKKSAFEEKLNTHIIAHTIKPRTQYANQQEKKNGKNMLYPVYYFDRERVHSMAMGGNYPIKECNFFVKTRDGGYVKIN